MIQPLRTVHRRSFYAMAVLLPLIFFAGVYKRDPQLAVAVPVSQAASSTPWPSHLVATRISSHADSVAVKLQVLRPLREPDPLLYFSPSLGGPGGLPEDAVLLGPARDGAELSLPGPRGRLILYSLAHSKVLDQQSFEVLP